MERIATNPRKPLRMLSGLIVALTTPFNDKNRLERKMVVGHVQFLVEHKVKTLLVNGTTGEFFSMTWKERRDLHKVVRKYFSGTIIYHASSHCLADTIAEARWGEDHGADAVAALPPYYLSNLESKGLIDYFNGIADAINIPFILYNHTKQTQNPVTKKILSSVNHFGLKDSSKNYSLIKSTARYFVGADSDILGSYRKGGRGFVSACANFDPELYVRLDRALHKKDLSTARVIEKNIVNLSRRYAGPNKISKVKYEVSKRVPGYPVNVRLPLVSFRKP